MLSQVSWADSLFEFAPRYFLGLRTFWKNSAVKYEDQCEDDNRRQEEGIMNRVKLGRDTVRKSPKLQELSEYGEEVASSGNLT
jgi:hypothetical protein